MDLCVFQLYYSSEKWGIFFFLKRGKPFAVVLGLLDALKIFSVFINPTCNVIGNE